MNWIDITQTIVAMLLAVVPGIVIHHSQDWAYRYLRQYGVEKKQEEDPVLGVMIPDYVLNYLQDYADRRLHDSQEENDEQYH